jgi:hypothetical protein
MANEHRTESGCVRILFADDHDFSMILLDYNMPGIADRETIGVFPKTMCGLALLMGMKPALAGEIYVPWRNEFVSDRGVA